MSVVEYRGYSVLMSVYHKEKPEYLKQAMAARMGVSWSAIRIRLQQMQVIKGKPIHCHPLDIIRFGE